MAQNLPANPAESYHCSVAAVDGTLLRPYV